MLPWQLNEGIFIEDKKILVPWGTKIEDLCQFGNPFIDKRETSVHIKWKEIQAFGGLNGILSTSQFLDEFNIRAYTLYLPEMHHISIQLPETFDTPSLAQIELRRIYEHLKESLGEATFSYPKYLSAGLPAIFWELPSIQFSCCFNAHIYISISHEPEGYDKIKAEALKIKQEHGPGSRVEYVAWNEELE